MILKSSDFPNPALMGGKAAALAELSAHGLPIPPWFVISPEAFDATLTSEQKNEIRSATQPAAVQRILTQMQMSADMTQAIQQAAHDLSTSGELLAVRSSAVDEDGADHSFAGQLESFLCVPADQVSRRVCQVWQSGFSERVFRYRLEHKMPLPPSPPAVLVQQMIDADVSGVAFAADPITGSRSTIVISAVFGLGTALVGGDADCDTYRLNHSGELLEQKIVRKNLRHVADSGSQQGFREEAVAESIADRPSLDSLQFRQIAELALSVSKLRGRPQDIEWASKNGKLFLLQARPITSLANLPEPDGVRAIWDNSNIAESYSGITTPLTFSFARRAYEGAYRQFCRIMKVSPRVIADNDSIFSQMLGLIRGRVYYNLLNWYRLLSMLPGYSVNQKFMEQMMGVREGISADIAPDVGVKSWTDRFSARLRLAWSAGGLIWNHFTLPRTIRRFYVRLNQAMSPPVPPLTDMRLDQLAAEFRKLESRLVSRWDAPLINDFLAMIFFGSLGKLCKKWCSGKSENLQNDLIGDEGGIISTEPAHRISEMAGLIAGDDPFMQALCKDDVITLEKMLSARPALRKAYREYLERFGDRCLEELKLESATLADNPLPLLRSIGQTAKRQSDASTPVQPFRARGPAEAQVADSLRGHRLKAVIFNWVLRHARGRVKDRENLRFERTRLFGRVRRIFVEMGARLRSEGLLQNPRDIFYLTLDEILAFCEGTSVLENLGGLATLRQKQFDAYRDLPAPAERFETRGAVYLGNRFEAAAKSEPTNDAGELKGIGCCPGIVRGPVRVIRDPRNAQIKHGEILVAERTDPGWILLFPAAAAILVERGSLLSHSAIVAREMGIPAVVSIPALTKTLLDGEWVEMNGSLGTVRRIPTP